MKTAIVLGATGLVGSQLVKLLLEDDSFSRVRLIGRRSTGIIHDKLEEVLVDFENSEDWSDKIKGDVLFSAFGTTLNKAGSKEAQYKVDYHYQYLVARLAAENRVLDYVIVSAPGADPKSRIFYNRMKGELDRDISKLTFDKIRIIQPSILFGDREEVRIGEKVGIFIGNLLLWIPGLRKYKPISGLKVAKAMIKAYEQDHPFQIVVYGPGELHKLAAKFDEL